MIDNYSGWIEAYAIKNKSNESSWERMASDYIPIHGAPQILMSDQESELCGATWEQWLEKNHIEHCHTSGCNPQSISQTESANGAIRRLLQKLVNGECAAWEEQLGHALSAVRNNVPAITGYTPGRLHHA